MIRDCVAQDAVRIAEIYNYYVENTVISFEEEPITADMMSGRMAHITQSLPWLVYEGDRVVIRYRYARPWKERAAYRHSVACSLKKLFDGIVDLT